MVVVGKDRRQSVIEYCDALIESYPVLLEISLGLLGIPFKDQILIRPQMSPWQDIRTSQHVLAVLQHPKLEDFTPLHDNVVRAGFLISA